jgi:hypothetical protein
MLALVAASKFQAGDLLIAAGRLTAAGHHDGERQAVAGDASVSCAIVSAF